MKKIFGFLMAAAVLFGAASCAKEDISSSIANGEQVEVTFTANLPELGTRAYGDGLTATNLQYFVYEKNGNDLTQLNALCGTAGFTNRVAKVNLALIKGMTYVITFWADNNDAPYTFYGQTVRINYTNGNATIVNANDEKLDAFYGTKEFNPSVDTDTNVELRRPFAQLNAIATDFGLVKKSGINVLTSSEVTVKGYNTLNLLDGTVSGSQDITFDIAAIPEGTITDTNAHLAMNYILVNEKELVNATFKFYGKYNESDATEKELAVNTYTNIPLQRNYKTNIIGSLLTKSTDFNVTIDANWATTEKYVLAGGEVTLTENLVANNIVVKEDTVLNLNGYNVESGIEYVAGLTGTDIAAITIENGATLTIIGEGTIKGTTYGVYAKEGNLIIKGGNYIAGTSAVQVAKANVRIEGGTFEATSTDKRYVINCLDADYKAGRAVVEITGGTFVAFNPANNAAEGQGTNFVVNGYCALEIGNHYYVLPEVVADAAVAANVTAVTESTADVATALATDNGEATMFMWNDVAYIAKYGEVVIASSADEATTSRAIVESATTLTRATVAEGVEVVGNRTFRQCANLETVTLPNSLTEIGPAVFQSCTALKNIVLPESVTVLGKGSFQECSSLESINIPAGVTRIEADCLRATGLKEVEFHAGVTYFGAQAFRDCKQLKKVVIKAPEFTVEANAFGITSGALPGTVIEVANAEMKAYLESTLAYKNQFTIIAPEVASNAADLQAALAKGKYVALSQDIFTEATTIAPYGNKYGFKMDGGVLDGNNYELDIECYGDDYGIMTSGGTIKNLTIDNGTRAIMLMYANQDVILDNVNLGGDGVLYPINTGEAGVPANVNLVVTNSTIAGWTSYGNINSASFTNVEFKQGTYYNNIYGRVLKPYVNTVFTNCSFIEHMNLDLSALTNGHKITIKNCTVNGQAVTTDVFTVPTNDAQYDTELFTIDLPSWATSVADCVIFE